MSPKLPRNPVLFGFFATKPHLKWAIIALSFVLVATAVDRLSIITLKNLTDSLAQKPTNMDAVWFWGLLFPSIYIIDHLLWRGSGFSGMQWFSDMRATAYRSLYEYLTLHNKDYFSSRFSGALVNKISNAVDGIDNLFGKFLWNFIPLIVGLVWYVAIVAFSDYRLALILGIWATIFLSLNILFAKKLQPRSFRSAQALSNLKGKLVDSLSNISLVHEYAHVKGEREYINSYVMKHRHAFLSRWRLSEFVLIANGLQITLFIVLMLATSLMLYEQNLISIGVVVMVIFMVGDITGQLFFIGQEIRDAARYYGEAREGLEEIVTKHQIVDAENATNLKALHGEITYQAVTFEYENTKVFSQFSLTIPAGQKVGFVGKSGAGKSTFVSLLLRHFDVKQGSILIDKQDITTVTLESLRRAVAFVPQDTSLFHRSIRENIRYSNPHATNAAVEKAAKLAQAHEFITKLPDGYDTFVGERGVKLSGGQRQRIAIARAFLKDAPILVLDEATSSLDSESEQAIQESLEELMHDRTVIAIAHRLSTLKEMDRIVILENGKIVEDGNPEVLLKKPKGKFKAMWDHQIKGFILDE